MAGISDKALKSQYAQNRYKYNGGNELQSQEFSDGSGLELYDARHRMYDPQIGRFGQIDPLGEIAHQFSPYSFALDDPILLNDPLDDSATLPTVYVTALNPNSITARLNTMNAIQVDAWVEMMMTRYHHSGTQIDNWAARNRYLTHDAREWVMRGTTDTRVKTRAYLNKNWKAQGKLYKFFLISAVGMGAGEAVGALAEADEGLLFEEGAEADEGMAAEEEAAEASEPTSGETAATRNGRAMHKSYRADEVEEGVREKEYTLPSGKRVDFIDLEKKIIYELKPNNARAIKLGESQLAGCKAEAERVFG